MVHERNLHPFKEKPFDHDHALDRGSRVSGQEPVMNIRCLSLILLLLCCAVPLAAAGGMAKVYLSPAEASWQTGQTVQVKVMYDNNLNPVAKDISLYLDWNGEMLKYESCDFKVGNSVTAGLLSSHELNMMVGDFTNGYPTGDYPLAVLTFRVIGPGDTPILIRVARLNDMDGKPVTFVTGKGMYSISGDAVKNPGTVAVTTPKTTTQIPGGVIVVTPATTYTPIPTVPLTTYTQAGAQQPVVVATTLPPVQPAQPGGVPNWPVLTQGATIPTPYPTTIETTVPTTEPTIIVTTTVPTTVPTTTPPTTWPTATQRTESTTVPTSTARQISYPTGNVVAPVGIPINDTPTVNETPSPERTLPSPIANMSNVTEEPTAEWPLDENATATPTLFIVRGTATKAAINNSSAMLAAPVSDAGGSILGDAWLLVLAVVAGVVLVGVGVVAMRRNRDDWL
jgi:hypothetical protein